MRHHTVVGLLLCLAVTACQSSGTPAVTSQTEAIPMDVAAPEGQVVSLAQEEAAQPPQPADQAAMMTPPNTAGALPAQCVTVLAGGPPPKPARGADFGKAVAKNTGKAVGRNILTMIGGQLGGQLGAAAASGLAQSEIRAEGDIKGTWNITDGNPNCACQLQIGGLFKIQGKGNDAGSIKVAGCATPALQKVANWALGYSFSGYDAKFELKARDKRTVLATMNRDGIHYFSGALADGTPVVMWRDGQNYSSFKK